MRSREVTTLKESQLEEVRLGKLKNGKAAGKDQFTGEIIKSGGDRVVDWIWRLCKAMRVLLCLKIGDLL